MQKIYFIFLLGFILGALPNYSQEKKVSFMVAKDTVKYKEINPLAPAKAAFYSAVLPGLGQAYNKKYWKLPIVWAGLAGLGYLWVNENNRYQDAKISYLSLLDTDVSNDIPFNGITNVTVVQSTKNVYRNQRDMYLLFGFLFYGLNIIDATVDAHFMNFDVSDDLSMQLNLDMRNYTTTQPVPSLTCTFNFKR